MSPTPAHPLYGDAGKLKQLERSIEMHLNMTANLRRLDRQIVRYQGGVASVRVKPTANASRLTRKCQDGTRDRSPKERTVSRKAVYAATVALAALGGCAVYKGVTSARSDSTTMIIYEGAGVW